MPTYRKARTSKSRKLIFVLFALAAVGLLLPRAWTGRLISFAQAIVWLQDAATYGASAAGEAVHANARPVPGEVFAKLDLEKQGLERENASLAYRVRELEREVEVLTATRMWTVEGARLGARGRLIPARVITEDLLSWRNSRLINAGSVQGVKSGAVVTSHTLQLDRGSDDRVNTGMAILLRESIVGVVDEHVGTHTSRVRLLSDVEGGMRVRLGRMTDGEITLIDRSFWLLGRGGGVMEIRDVDRADTDAGRIRVGDLVLTDPADGVLPVAMTIGRIKTIQHDQSTPVLAVLTVRSEIVDQPLQRVYVFDPGDARDENGG